MRRCLYLFIIICATTLKGQSGSAEVGQSQPRSIAVIQSQPKSTKPRSQPDSSEVLQAINTFVDAFSNLKWEEFSACWAEDATAFFPPSARFPYRAGNKQEVLNIFKHVFEYARKQKSSRPYIIIQPLDMRIQIADYPSPCLRCNHREIRMVK